MDRHVYAVVMAGGAGTRLWPLSHPQMPKPFVKLGAASLFQQTIARARQLLPQDQIWVITHQALVTLAQEQSGLAAEQIIGEPMARNTAPCIALAASFLQRRDPEAVMVTLPADHHIEDEVRLRAVLKRAAELAADGRSLVTLGVIPTYAATGYGYIEFDEAQALRVWKARESAEPIRAFRGVRFIEKPDRARAEELLQQGAYLWNSGIFVWKVSTILSAINEFLPDLAASVRDLFRRPGHSELDKPLRQVYEKLESLSIDYGVMQKARNIAVIPADIGWSDVGDWPALSALLAADGQGHRVVGARHITRQSRRLTVFSTQSFKTIATLGIEDVVIADTADTLLVAHQAFAQEVREIARMAADALGPSSLDVAESPKHDPHGMLTRLTAFPRQCCEAIELGRRLRGEPKTLQEIKRMVVLGMGGSGMVGELLRRLLAIPVHVQQHERIPEFVRRDTLLLAVSYSGETQETLYALEEGLSRSAKALCVTSGGRLLRLAQERGLPLICVPSGWPPRAALGYLFLSALAVLADADLYLDRESFAESLSVLEALSESCGAERAAGSNPAKQLAQRLWKKLPLVYGTWGTTDVVAQRWKTQINENSKQPAFANVLPELSHNEIEAFTLQRRYLPQGITVLLRSATGSPRDNQRFEALKSLLRHNGIDYVESWSRGRSLLAQMLSLIYLGDFVSVYLALLNGVDPWPVPAIEAFKQQLRSEHSPS